MFRLQPVISTHLSDFLVKPSIQLHSKEASIFLQNSFSSRQTPSNSHSLTSFIELFTCISSYCRSNYRVEYLRVSLTAVIPEKSFFAYFLGTIRYVTIKAISTRAIEAAIIVLAGSVRVTVTIDGI